MLLNTLQQIRYIITLDEKLSLFISYILFKDLAGLYYAAYHPQTPCIMQNGNRRFGDALFRNTQGEWIKATISSSPSLH